MVGLGGGKGGIGDGTGGQSIGSNGIRRKSQACISQAGRESVRNGSRLVGWRVGGYVGG